MVENDFSNKMMKKKNVMIIHFAFIELKCFKSNWLLTSICS